jgi:hypothetical protein
MSTGAQKMGSILGPPIKQTRVKGICDSAIGKISPIAWHWIFFAEKRSFWFQTFDIPDQYNKIKRLGVEIICHLR